MKCILSGIAILVVVSLLTGGQASAQDKGTHRSGSGELWLWHEAVHSKPRHPPNSNARQRANPRNSGNAQARTNDESAKRIQRSVDFTGRQRKRQVTPGQTSPDRAKLRPSGIRHSRHPGAVQFTMNDGSIRHMARPQNYTGEKHTQPTLLVPAVQKAREAAGRPGRHRGFSIIDRSKTKPARPENLSGKQHGQHAALLIPAINAPMRAPTSRKKPDTSNDDCMSCTH